MKRLLGALLLFCVLVGTAFGQDAAAMESFKAAKLAEVRDRTVSHQRIRTKRRTRAVRRHRKGVRKHVTVKRVRTHRRKVKRV